LVSADPSRGARSGRVVLQPEVVPQEDVFGVNGHVRLELAFPPAVRVLQREQVVDATAEAVVRAVDGAVAGGDRHRAPPAAASDARPGTSVLSSPSAARAAARPLRTAPSMV